MPANLSQQSSRIKQSLIQKAGNTHATQFCSKISRYLNKDYPKGRYRRQMPWMTTTSLVTRPSCCETQIPAPPCYEIRTTLSSGWRITITTIIVVDIKRNEWSYKYWWIEIKMNFFLNRSIFVYGYECVSHTNFIHYWWILLLKYFRCCFAINILVLDETRYEWHKFFRIKLTLFAVLILLHFNIELT